MNWRHYHEYITIGHRPLGMFCATFLLVGFVHNAASSSAGWSEHQAVSAKWVFGVVPKSDACSLLLTDILVKMAGSFLKEKPLEG